MTADPDGGYHLQEQIGFVLRKANQRHLAIFSARIGDLTPPQFAALATAGQLQIDGVDQSDLSGFSYSLTGGQGTLTLVPEPSCALLGGLGLLALLRRRRG